MVLATNGTKLRQRDKIERFGLADYFDEIIIEGEQGVGKPDESIYLAALSVMRAEPQDVWSVGDNLEWDVIAPKGLGMIGIWHDYTRSGLPDSVDQTPDRTIHKISELTELLVD